jgi:hypothetical protein
MLNACRVVSILVFALTLLTGCSSNIKPTTGLNPSEYTMLKEPFWLDGGSVGESDGELYGKILVQPKVNQPFMIDEFVIFYDDRNLGLISPQCGIIDESKNEYWFEYAYMTTRDHIPGRDLFNDSYVNLYSCVVTPPTAGNYQFAVRYETRDRWHEGPDMVVTANKFTVMP